MVVRDGFKLKLTQADRRMITNESGLKRVRIIKEHSTNVKLRGFDDSGVAFEGWWYDGEGAADIRWSDNC